MIPNFIIAGGSRCGTTALYQFLKEHPQISFPRLKEPRYFSSINNKFPHNGPGDYSIDSAIIKNFENYKNLFRNFNTKLVGEASPDYLYFYKNTVDEIYNTLGDIKIIIILRNPIDRAFSGYNHLVRDNREKLSFEKALKEEPNRKKNNYDFMWFYKEIGLYYQQVKAFKEKFSNVLVIFQENLREKPDLTLEKTFNFLGVENIEGIDFTINYNPVGAPNNPIAKFLLNRNNKLSYLLREFFKRTIPRNKLEKISSRFIKKGSLDKSIKDYLYNYYLEDIKKLEDLLETDLSLWLKNSKY
jgi:hypothetical protein